MAATIPSDGRIWYTGDHADIGSGDLANWSRDTNFDGRFFQGATVAGTNTTATTHGHTADAHTHTGNAHGHDTGVTGAASGSKACPTPTAPLIPRSTGNHAHIFLFGGVPNSTHTNSNTTVTINGTDGRPPYITAILIKPDDGNQDVPVGGVVFTKDTSAPTDFSVTDGTGGTDNLDDRFLQAPTTGGNGGSTGGSSTHSHTIVDHNHVQAVHFHDDGVFGQTFPSQVVRGTGVSFFNGTDNDHHTATNIGSGRPDTNNATGLSTNTASSLPAYTRLLGIQNTSAGDVEAPLNTIISFVGSSASIPSGWALCDGTKGTPDLTASQIYVTTTGGEVLDTGGSNTHTHTAGSSHTHTVVAHTHTYTFATETQSTPDGSGRSNARDTHTHTSSTVFNATSTNQNNTITMGTDDGRYSRRTILFIMRVLEADNPNFYGASF